MCIEQSELSLKCPIKAQLEAEMLQGDRVGGRDIL